MLFVVTALLSGVIGLIRGGRLYNLTGLALRHTGMPLLALGLQIFVIYGPFREDARPYGFSALLILGSYALLLVAVWANRGLPGMALLGLGAALNFAVILVNGGWMPVTAEDLATAGLLPSPTALEPGQRVPFTKDLLMDSQEVRLRWLSDVFLIPKAGPLSAVFGVGDVLMMLGLFRVIQFGMMSGTGRTDQVARG